MADAAEPAPQINDLAGLPPLEIYELSQKPENVDVQFKVTVAGAAGVGKSQLLNRFRGKPFQDNSNATIGVDFFPKYYKVKIAQTASANDSSGGDDSQTFFVMAQFWDTAGQERFQAMGSANYRGATAVLVVFSLTDSQSFEKVESYMVDAQQYSSYGDRTICILAGNKLDMCPQHRQVSTEQWSTWATARNVIGFETSAKENSGIAEVFSEVVRVAVLRKLGDQIRMSTNNKKGTANTNNSLPSSKPIAGGSGIALPVFDPAKDHTGTVKLLDPVKPASTMPPRSSSNAICGC